LSDKQQQPWAALVVHVVVLVPLGLVLLDGKRECPGSLQGAEVLCVVWDRWCVPHYSKYMAGGIHQAERFAWCDEPTSFTHRELWLEFVCIQCGAACQFSDLEQ